MVEEDHIKNLKIIKETFKNKTEKEIKQLLTSMADEETMNIKNKSS